MHLESVTCADWHRRGRRSPCDPASTMGLLSEMLLQMKQNVINNPLAADMPALQKRGEERDGAAIA